MNSSRWLRSYTVIAKLTTPPMSGHAPAEPLPRIPWKRPAPNPAAMITNQPSPTVPPTGTLPMVAHAPKAPITIRPALSQAHHRSPLAIVAFLRRLTEEALRPSGGGTAEPAETLVLPRVGMVCCGPAGGAAKRSGGTDDSSVLTACDRRYGQFAVRFLRAYRGYRHGRTLA